MEGKQVVDRQLGTTAVDRETATVMTCSVQKPEFIFTPNKSPLFSKSCDSQQSPNVVVWELL